MDKNIFKSRVRLRHLDCFVCVVQMRNLGKAADKLRLSQPAVSKTLNELEEIVGARLLERNRLGAKPTREGESFLVHAVAVLDALNAAHAAVGADNALTEAIHIGALPTVAPDLLPPALNAFRRNHPDTRIVIRTGTNATLLHMLKAGEIDVALARLADPEMMVGLTFELLYVEPMALAVRPDHPLAGKTGITLHEVAGYPLAVSAKGTIPRHNAESLFQSQGMKLPANCIETLSVSVGRQIVRQSDTIWLTPVGAVRDDIAEGHLAALKLSTEGIEEPVGLLQRNEAVPGPAAKAFIAELRDAAAVRRR